MDPTISPPNNGNNGTTTATATTTTNRIEFREPTRNRNIIVFSSSIPSNHVYYLRLRMRNRNSPEQGRHLYANFYNLRNRNNQQQRQQQPQTTPRIRVATLPLPTTRITLESSTPSNPTASPTRPHQFSAPIMRPANENTYRPINIDNEQQPIQSPTTIQNFVQNTMEFFLNNNRLRENFANFFYVDRPSGLTSKEIDSNTLTYDYKPATKRPRLTRMSSRNNSNVGNNEEINGCNNIKINEENETCCICLNRFCSRLTLRRLPCLHVFHLKCVDKWLQNNRKCPICRISILINYDDLIKSLKDGNSIETFLNQQDNTTRGQILMFDNIPNYNSPLEILLNINRINRNFSIIQTTTSNESNQ